MFLSWFILFFIFPLVCFENLWPKRRFEHAAVPLLTSFHTSGVSWGQEGPALFLLLCHLNNSCLASCELCSTFCGTFLCRINVHRCLHQCTHNEAWGGEVGGLTGGCVGKKENWKIGCVLMNKHRCWDSSLDSLTVVWWCMKTWLHPSVLQLSHSEMQLLKETL